MLTLIWISKTGLGVRRGEPSGRKPAMGNDKGCSLPLELISHSEGFRGPLIIGSVYFKDVSALVLVEVGCHCWFTQRIGSNLCFVWGVG